MSLLDLASMVLAPTAVKDGKVYNAIPNDQDFTFSRGTEATRVNSAGLIEKARTNLLLQSNQFDTTWVNNGTTETGGQSGYDGSNDAWLINKSIAGGSIRQSIIFNGVGTYSVYAKAGTLNYVLLYLNYGSGTDTQAYFDLQNGNVGTTIAEIDANIESIGNGWYRCSVTFNTPSATATVLFFPADGDGDTSGTSGNILIQDAQLEQGLVATDYIETTTSSVTVGVTDDLPRVDYSGGGCPSLLLEPSRTNLFEHSEYFEGSYWGKTQQGSASVPVVTGNYAISPEGVQNATRVQFDAVGSTSSDRSGLVRDFAFTSGTTYSISCWVKATSGNSELVQFRVAGAQVGGEQTATDEWQLFTATHTATASVTDNFGMQVRGNNTTNESDILIYGMQLEQNASYASSYIPTYGTSTSRSADSCSLTNASNLIGQSEGTIYFEATIVAEDSTSNRRLISISDGSTANAIQIFNRVATEKLEADCNVSGVSQFSIQSGDVGYDTPFKFALAYKENDIAFYVNGSQIGTDSSASIPSTSKIAFSRGDDNFKHEGGIKQAILFPTRLTNDQLQELTK